MYDHSVCCSQLGDLKHVKSLTLHLFPGEELVDIDDLQHLGDMDALERLAVRWEDNKCPRWGEDSNSPKPAKVAFRAVYNTLQSVVEGINRRRSGQRRPALQVDYMEQHVPWWEVVKQRQ